MEDGIREALLLLPVLGVAAGADLFATLVVLGAAPATPWLRVLPGSLPDLATPWVIVPAATLWLLEVGARSRPSPALAWNAVQAGVRPLAAGLLALLLLDGGPGWIAAAGALGAGALAGAAHGLASGWSLLRHARRIRRPRRSLVALGLSAGSIGLVVLGFEHAATAAALSALLLAVPAAAAPRLLGLSCFGVRLAWDRLWSLSGRRGWRSAARLPAWAAGPDEGAAGGLRGCRAAALLLPPEAGLLAGWLVTGRGEARIRTRSPRGVREVTIRRSRGTRIEAEALFVRVAGLHAGPEGGDPVPALLLVTRAGPDPDTLLAGLPAPGDGARRGPESP